MDPKIKRLLTFALFVLIIATMLLAGCVRPPEGTPAAMPTPNVTPATTPAPTSQPVQKDPFRDAVVNSDLIVLGIVTTSKKETVAPQNLKYNVLTLSIEKVIKGDSSIKEVIIRKPGGSYDISAEVLVALRAEEDNIYTIVENGELGYKSRTVITAPSSNEVIGLLIVSMKANNIPIALPPSEWPPLPTGPITRPGK